MTPTDTITKGTRIITDMGDAAVVLYVKSYTGSRTKLIVKWDPSPMVTQSRTISYHSRYGNSVWLSDVTATA